RPHYHVTSTSIILYPKYEWMVSYWGLFFLGDFPVMVMPTYIYDFHAEKNLPPFPVVGADPDQGNYISESLAWYLNPLFSGTYSIGYAANKGLTGGAQANYLINDQNSGTVTLQGNVKDGPSGGVTHDLVFGNIVNDRSSSAFELFQVPQQRQYELELSLSSREKVNYQQVSQLPEVHLRSRAGRTQFNDLKYDLDLGGGVIEEEGNTRLGFGSGWLRLYDDLPEMPLGLLTPSLLVDLTYYSDGTKWLKPSAAIDLAKVYSQNFQLTLGYQHYLLVRGNTPFLFQQYRFRAADRLSSSLLFKIGQTKGRVAASYFLDNWTPEDIDYTLFFILHCYDLEVTYRSLRGEFLLSFSLGGTQ
ncbi:MAG TPA: hypothetical protein VMT55_04565, partial [Candidatus Sulfotelmatobacter sp.]|nr:hypothetical protein [Candidatus Sulfotelmatobacter sp.]